MKGTLKIGTFFNIPVYLHWSFALILGYVLYIANEGGYDWQGTLWTLITVLSLFICVILHEYGHALTARRYGVSTRDIIMYPIGGVARLERLPEKPFHEFLVAIAGPAVNILIVLILMPYFFIVPFGEAMQAFERYELSSSNSFIPALMFLNIGLAIFNLIPAFPMDGGRIFRSLLAMKFGRLTATKWAYIIGRIVAVGMVFLGYWTGGFSMSLIGVFIFMMAGQEYKQVKFESQLETHQVHEIMRTNFTKMYLDEPIFVAMSELQKGQERNFLVFNRQEELQGTLSERNIIKAIKEKQTGAFVGNFMDRNYETTISGESLKLIFEKMSQKGYTILPVFQQEELLGVIDIQGMNYFIQLQNKVA